MRILTGDLIRLFLFSGLFILLAQPIDAQSLTFNRVVNLKGSATGLIILDTVPQGKVWKIESISTEDVSIFMKITGTGASTDNHYITLFADNRPVVSPGYSSSVGVLMRPLWLTAGEIIGASGSNGYDTYYLSIIEFNVTP